MNRRILIALLAVSSFICPAIAQNAALKTNLLYDATSTINLGFEFGLSPNGLWMYPATTTLGHFPRTRNGSIGLFSQKPDTGSAIR